jgi:uncharacterized phage protein gp47/JayE
VASAVAQQAPAAASLLQSPSNVTSKIVPKADQTEDLDRLRMLSKAVRKDRMDATLVETVASSATPADKAAKTETLSVKNDNRLKSESVVSYSFAKQAYADNAI